MILLDSTTIVVTLYVRGAVFPYTAEIGIWQLQHLAAGTLQISQGVTNSKKRNVPSSRDQY